MSIDRAAPNRPVRQLVEELDFRTIVCAESWGSGVVLDRYVRGDGTSARSAVGQARAGLRSQAMLDLVRWMREFNRGRPGWDQVRFLGADVLEPRALQYAELERFAADVAPARLPRTRELLATLAMRGGPRDRRALVAAARELDALVRDVASTRAARRGRSTVDPGDAVLHAFALLGFYESRSAAGGDELRERYAADIVTHWQDRTGHRIVHATV
ncbi:erythromycin esterase family protein [Jiangella ureilytica]|nr:erythromycin esterase family protein [Jiangella ureilytica]